MLYRICYEDSPAQARHEATVEANSPDEAIVKFRMVRAAAVPSPVKSHVTSVFVDDEAERPCL